MSFEPSSIYWPMAVKEWLSVIGVLVAIGMVLGLLASIVNRGIGRGVGHFVSELLKSLEEILTVSPRRVWALCRLTIKEAIRRKALLVFVVFAILFMFAGWFLSEANQRPALQIKVYVSFVLTAISWLTMPVVLLLACWGLPEDIRLRSLHTVVTKPARRLEIVLGRMLGFSAIGLLVLTVMGVVGYVWIMRQVNEEDKHLLACRVPVHGNLRFLDREGRPAERGVNTGDVWMFRSYIEGATRARAIWIFEDIKSGRIGESLEIESQFEAFRTHKGRDMSRGLICQYTISNDLREQCFVYLSAVESLRVAADFLRGGQYANAADELAELADRIDNGEVEMSAAQLTMTQYTSDQSARVLQDIEVGSSDSTWRQPLVDAMQEVSRGASVASATAVASGEPDLSELASATRKLGGAVRDNADALRKHLVAREVALAPFEVREYRDGENVVRIPRQITYEATDEDVTRLLASALGDLNEQGQLVVDGQLNAAPIDALAAAGTVTDEHSQSVQTALNELIADGTISVADGKLVAADGSTFFAVIDGLVRSGRVSTNDLFELEADLFKDLTNDGRLIVKVACHSPQQYLGMARPDLFVRLPSRPFAVGYSKAIVAIGMMLILVVAIGVASSCFVKGPVATLLTLSLVMVGVTAHGFLNRIVSGQVQGSGVLASIIRIKDHLNPQVAIEADERVLGAIERTDSVANSFLWGVKHIIPNFSYFSESSKYVENGFDVPWDTALLPSIATTVAFLIPCLLLGFLTLKYRELESK